MRKFRVRWPSPAMVVATAALCLALVGTAIAASALTRHERKQVGKIANKKITFRAAGLSVASARTAGNVYAASVTNGCTGTDGGTGGIPVAPAANECRVTFPHNITGCAIVLGTRLDFPGGGETTYRKISSTVVEVSRRDSAGGTPTAGAFSIAAICGL
jgi:hypothetical protein